MKWQISRWIVGMGLLAGLLSGSNVLAGERMITVTGTVDDPEATVEVNSVKATVSEGHFSAEIKLTEGSNTITAIATDPAGNSKSVSVRVTLDTVPPVIVITSPEEGQLFGAK